MSLKKAYLLLYNSAQLACWSWALGATVLALSKGPAEVYESAAPAVRKWSFLILSFFFQSIDIAQLFLFDLLFLPLLLLSALPPPPPPTNFQASASCRPSSRPSTSFWASPRARRPSRSSSGLGAPTCSSSSSARCPSCAVVARVPRLRSSRSSSPGQQPTLFDMLGTPQLLFPPRARPREL